MDGENSRSRLNRPVREIFSLTVDVDRLLIAEDGALTRIAEHHGFGIAESDLDQVMTVVVQFRTNPEFTVRFARFVQAAVEARYGKRPDGPWWRAVIICSHATQNLLKGWPDAPGLFEATVSLRDARALFETRGGGRLPPGSELADILTAAADLFSVPYTQALEEPFPLNALLRWRVREGKYTKHIRGTGPEQNPNFETPSPFDGLGAGLQNYVRAAAIASGELRWYIEYQKLRVLSLAQLVAPNSHSEYETERAATATQVLRLLPPTSHPRERAEAWAILVAGEHRSRPYTADEILGTSVQSLLTHFPERDAASALIHAAAALGPGAAADALWTVLRGLLDRSEARGRAGLTATAAHVLPGNQLTCPGLHFRSERTMRSAFALIGAGSDLFRNSAFVSGVAGSDTGTLATLVHALAHTPEGVEDDAVFVLESLEVHQRPFFSGYQNVLRSLQLFLELSSGQQHVYAKRFLESTRAYAAAGSSNDGGPHDFFIARDILTLGMMSCGYASQPPAEAQAAASIMAMTTHRIVPPLVDSADARHANYIRGVGLALDEYLTERGVGGAARLLHHKAFKGSSFSAVYGNVRPQRLGPMFPDILERIIRAERANGAYQASRMDEIEGLELGELPSDFGFLAYARPGESVFSDDARDDVGNLRRYFDQSVQRALANLLPSEGIVRYGSNDAIDDLEFLQQQIPAGTVLISLYLGRRPGYEGSFDGHGARLTSVAITRETIDVECVNLDAPGASVAFFNKRTKSMIALHEMSWTVADLREAVQADPIFGELTANAQALLERHYLKMGGPSQSRLELWRDAGKRHLCFWPHGPLHFVPFSLLRIMGRPLADDWCITTIPTGVSAYMPRQPAHPEPTLLAVATDSGGERFGLRRQPGLENHAASVAGGLPRSRVVAGNAATPANFLREAGRFKYLYIAAHGSHDVEATWFQCIYLQSDGDRDGRLFAHEILTADMRGVDLVGLSACETALGRFDENDNLRGLPAAFLMSGVSTVVGTLWPVDPEVSSHFFRILFQHLASGDAKLQAFRAAQTATRRAFPAGRDWGSFTMIGNWS